MASLGLAALAWGGGVPCGQCFPVETLPEPLRAKSRDLLLKTLDSEALYTWISGLKPMSSGMARFEFDVARPDLAAIEEARKLASAWRCGGGVLATVHHFQRVYEGKRYADLAVIHRTAFRRMLERYAGFFAPYGITPSAEPMEAVMAIEYDPTPARLRGMGYFFGYPEHAIDFFVQAEHDRLRTGRMTPRSFYSVPTFARAERGVIWAVPLHAPVQEQDRAFLRRAERILEEYRRRRERHTTPSGVDAVALLREWLDDGSGFCSLDHVTSPEGAVRTESTRRE